MGWFQTLKDMLAKDESAGMTEMKCPACRRTRLRETRLFEFGRVILDICPRCSGLWIEKELKAIGQWCAVAFAARCARRIQPKCSWPHVNLWDVNAMILELEHAATDARLPPQGRVQFDGLQLPRHYGQHFDMLTLRFALMTITPRVSPYSNAEKTAQYSCRFARELASSPPPGGKQVMK